MHASVSRNVLTVPVNFIAQTNATEHHAAYLVELDQLTPVLHSCAQLSGTKAMPSTSVFQKTLCLTSPLAKIRPGKPLLLIPLPQQLLFHHLSNQPPASVYLTDTSESSKARSKSSAAAPTTILIPSCQ